VEVQEEANRGGYLKFLDNCAVLTVEEGEMESKKLLRICSSFLIRNGTGSIGN
jgi:hypothetical protein